MANCLYTLILISALGVPIQPLGLEWGKKENSVPQVENYRYWYGDPAWGTIIYNGIEDVEGFNTELHLHFSHARLVQATVIFGPAGLAEDNCYSRYRFVVNSLNKKYGQYTYKKLKEDPDLEEMIFVTDCYAVSRDMKSVTTVWKLKDFTIKALLVGEEGQYFVEVDYDFLGAPQKSSQEILKTL